MYTSNKRIVIKQGWNKRLIFSTIASVGFIVICVVSSVLLPDSRAIMKGNNNTAVIFMRNTLTTPEDFYYDEERNMIEIEMVETIVKDSSDEYNVQYMPTNEDGNELPFFVSRSTCKFAEDKQKCQTRVLMQVVVPKNFYYVDIKVSQLDNKVEHVQLDYRNFKDKVIIEKGEDYYKNLENEEQTLDGLKKKYDGLSDDEKEQDIDKLKEQISAQESIISELKK